MPLLVAPFVGALLGVLLALAGRDEIRRTTVPPASTRGFLVTCLVSCLLFAPALGYFVAFYPDWAYAYLISGRQIPSAIDLVEVLVSSAVPPFTFAWAASSLRRHAVRELVRGVSVVVVALGTVLVVFGGRWLVLTSSEAFREGYDLQPITGTSLGVSLAWMDGCLALAVGFAATQLRRVGR